MIYDYDFREFKKQLEEKENWLKDELSNVRTGRANVSILDGVQVDSYGSLMPINQLANIGTEGPRSIRVNPYDMSQVKEIEKVITAADLGVSVSSDDQGVRINFPELTSERREEYAKIASKKGEEAKVGVRQARDDVWEDIQKKKADGEVGEDDMYRFKDEMQKLVDETNKRIDEMVEKKKEEVMS